MVSGPPCSNAPYASRLRPRYPRRFFGATTKRVPPPAAATNRRESTADNKESLARGRHHPHREIAGGPTFKTDSVHEGPGDLDGPDGEHAEVHEGEPAADQRQAPELRDVDHLRDRGDLAQGLRPGRARDDR